MPPTPASWTGTNTIGLTWLVRIDAAVTVGEVLDVVRVYLAHLTPAEVAFLKPNCRPPKLVDGNDIAEYALELVRETCTDDPAPPLVLKIAAVVSHASARVSELMTLTNDAQAQARTG